MPETETYAAARELAERVALKSEETVRRLKQSINNTTGAAEYRARYRAEASYTYELNIRGVASEGRSDFIDKKRASYLDSDSSK